MTPEQQARVNIDALLQQAGWHVAKLAELNLTDDEHRRRRGLGQSAASRTSYGC